MSKARIEVHETKGNIFADLGMPDADTHFLKAQIVAEVALMKKPPPNEMRAVVSATSVMVKAALAKDVAPIVPEPVPL